MSVEYDTAECKFPFYTVRQDGQALSPPCSVSMAQVIPRLYSSSRTAAMAVMLSLLVATVVISAYRLKQSFRQANRSWAKLLKDQVFWFFAQVTLTAVVLLMSAFDPFGAADSFKIGYGFINFLLTFLPSNVVISYLFSWQRFLSDSLEETNTGACLKLEWLSRVVLVACAVPRIPSFDRPTMLYTIIVQGCAVVLFFLPNLLYGLAVLWKMKSLPQPTNKIKETSNRFLRVLVIVLSFSSLGLASGIILIGKGLQLITGLSKPYTLEEITLDFIYAISVYFAVALGVAVFLTVYCTFSILKVCSSFKKMMSSNSGIQSD